MQPNQPRRVAVEHVHPDVGDGIDGAPFAAKQVVGDDVDVRAAIFADGHNLVAAVVEFRHRDEEGWRSAPMAEIVNDEWAGTFRVDRTGEYRFRIVAWIDQLATWAHGFVRKVEAAQDVTVDRAEGASLLEQAAKRCRDRDADTLGKLAERLRAGSGKGVDKRTLAGIARAVETSRACPDRATATVYDATSPVWVDRELAVCGAWYELFPRSASPDPRGRARCATSTDRLPTSRRWASTSFYLPPIHPIGIAHRKGANNATDATPGDPGSPWAIGCDAGGHTAVHPQLGTIADFDRLVREARKYEHRDRARPRVPGSPDHPWVSEHPQWFRHRPDGSIAYAENPPKKYEDIVPFDFDSEDRAGAVGRAARRRPVLDRPRRARVPGRQPAHQAVRVLGVAHRRGPGDEPDVIFLAEAFTRPRVMEQLAKVGFTQSYTYFTWRNAKHELTEYFTELTTPPLVRLLPAQRVAQHARHPPRDPAARHAAARSSPASCSPPAWRPIYGVYGPVFELQERTPRRKGSEEYLDSEKYQIRHWDTDRPDSLRHFLARLNAIRRAHPALQRNDTLRFHDIDNDQLLCWSKGSGDDVVLCVVNLDPVARCSRGWTALDLGALGVGWDEHVRRRTIW